MRLSSARNDRPRSAFRQDAYSAVQNECSSPWRCHSVSPKGAGKTASNRRTRHFAHSVGKLLCSASEAAKPVSDRSTPLSFRTLPSAIIWFTRQAEPKGLPLLRRPISQSAGAKTPLGSYQPRPLRRRGGITSNDDEQQSHSCSEHAIILAVCSAALLSPPNQNT